MRKFVCVTGADRGVGLALVQRLLTLGYSVFAGKYYSHSIELELLKKENEQNLFIMDLDIGNETSVLKAVGYINEVTDTIEFLINNGAILGDTEKTILEQLDFEDVQRVFNVNAVGPLRMTNSLIPLILNSESKLVVNISSEAGSIDICKRIGWFAYCMSKSALNMQSAIIHNQIKKDGGQVLVIHPGHVRTYMQGKLDESAVMTAAECAEYLVDLIRNHKKYDSDKPAFIDYMGEVMPW